MLETTDQIRSYHNKNPKRSQHLDRAIGDRIRERRSLIGVSLHELSEAIGVTYNQGYKYERGIDRISCSRLFHIARTLGASVEYFYRDIDDTRISRKDNGQERQVYELIRNFLAIPHVQQQEAVCHLVKQLTGSRERDAWDA